MAHLSKELLLKTYKTLSGLTEDHRQGQTQIVSAMRHLLALDMYFKKNNTNCSLGVSSNRDDFVENVKKVVNISGDYYTTNFYTTIKPLSDCGVGSNFFSAGVVNNSKQNTAYLYDYPTRGQYPLFRVKNNELIREIAYYKNVRYYLKSAEIKSAFVLWVLRKSFLTELNAASIKDVLQEFLTTELIEELMPKEEEFNQYVKDEQIVTYPSELDVDDLLSLFHERNEEHEDSIKLSHKYRTYLTALRTKPFLLLAGISGTGKSRIVRELAFMSCPKYLQDKDGVTPGNYCMIEVKPNWHDSTELLGYYSNISKGYQFKKFVKFLVKAKMHPEVPFFVCLDEMNLAPVEQYFAEILSILETRKHPKTDEGVDMDRIKTEVIVESKYFKSYTYKDEAGALHDRLDMTDKDWYETFFNVTMMTDQERELINGYQYSRTLQQEGLSLPDNVIIIGTVNMDETTHQFSRKVIDRAMTIEMNGGRLSNMFGGSKRLEYLPEVEQQKWQGAFKQRYVSADEVLELHPEAANDIKEKLPARLDDINKALKETPFEVSYRVLNELVIMVGVMLDYNTEGKDIDAIINEAVDRILLMKILPRMEGDNEMFALSHAEQQKYGVKYANRLEWLLDLAPEISVTEDADADHQQTAKEKIQEMIDRLESREFTRYWP